MKIGVATAIYISNDRLFEFARDTLASIVSERHDIVTCGWLNRPLENGYRSPFEERGHTHDNDENNVSRAWNRGINHMLEEGCDYVFVPNLDIKLGPNALDLLLEAVEHNQEPVLWTMDNWHYLYDRDGNPGLDNAPLRDVWVPHPHFSAFLVNRRLFDLVGPFDENLRPAYNEDLDMHWRIRLAGLTAMKYEGARFYHHGSRTIGEDHELNTANVMTHQANNVYFAQKWAYKPPTADDPFTDGMFRYPFDDPARVGMEREFMKTW